MMKLNIIIASLLAGTAFFAQPKIVDKVVAKVGDRVILQSDIQQEKLQLMQEQIQVTPEMECMIVEQLMLSKLMLNQAELDSVVIPDQQVDSELERRLRYFENMHGSREKMEAFYQKTTFQIKAELSQSIRDQLTTQEMQRKITENIRATPRDVREFFESIPRDSLPDVNAQVAIEQLVIYPELTEKDKLDAKRKLEAIRRKITSRASTFEKEAKANSDDPGSRAQGGLIEAYRGQMVGEFDAVAFSLNIGEVSEVFETQFGYHIMKLENRRGDAYTCRHILIMPKVADAALAKADMLIEQAYKELKSGSITWEGAIQKYCNDPGLKNAKGKLVHPYTGEPFWSIDDLLQFDPALVQLISNLTLQQISQPTTYDNRFESKEGVRIVKVVNRIKPHRANMEEDYQLIQSAAENKKKEEAIAEWVNEKMLNAYVRIDNSYNQCNYIYNWNRINP
jgi:peptidyl-prolyl cis-trans isomerase SurA